MDVVLEVAAPAEGVMAEDDGFVDVVADLLFADDGADQDSVGPAGEPG